MSLESVCDEKVTQLAEVLTDGTNAQLQARACALQEKFFQLRERPVDERLCTELLDAMQQSQRLLLLFHAGASDDTIAATDAPCRRRRADGPAVSSSLPAGGAFLFSPLSGTAVGL